MQCREIATHSDEEDVANLAAVPPSSNNLDDIKEDVIFKIENLLNVDNFYGDLTNNDLLALQRYSSKTPHRPREVTNETNSFFGKTQFANLALKVFKNIRDFDSNMTSYGSKMNNKSVLIVLWNASNMSADLCTQIKDSDLLKIICDDLSKPSWKEVSTTSDREIRHWVSGSLGILHNLIQKFPEYAKVFQEHGVFDLCLVYMESNHLLIKTKALLILAHIVSEDQNEQVNTSDKNIQFIIKILESAVSGKDHISKRYGFGADETVAGLNKLAVNDMNKVTIINSGAVPLLVKLLQDDCSNDEQHMATNGIYTLAFCKDLKAKEALMHTKGLLDRLKYLAAHSAHEDVKHAAEGALWELKGPEESRPMLRAKGREASDGPMMKMKKKTAPARKMMAPASQKADEGRHIMISYQWSTQQLVIKLRDSLKAKGYSVWMDIDRMSGSVLEAMALAVEQASVILVCMTEKYKLSPSCRSEAEYACLKKKTIVPLIMSCGYQPDGWLGIILGMKLYFDFSLEANFNTVFQNLLREIQQGQGNAVVLEEKESSPEEELRPKPKPKPPVVKHESGFQSWSCEQVQSWLRELGLQDLSPNFFEVDGSLLNEFVLMQTDAPEAFYSSLRSDMRLSLNRQLKLSKGLRDLGHC